MGRKQNPSQRTKGNLKPSSSAKAAELLEASGNASGGFLGFGLLGSTAQELDETDSCIDADYAMVMKKMTKRDTITKLKAVQEFSRLCKEKETDAVNSILQYWPKIFAKLTTDSDCRVREATNEAFEQLVVRVKRNLAVHLKNVMGPWIVAQCDVYAPAATAARNAFNCAFSPEKQADAFGFCKHEILQHIEEILLKKSQYDQKTDDEAEAESRQLQMLSSALESLSLFITKLPLKQQETMQDDFNQIFRNSKFWKLGKHSAGMVRAGFYHAIASFAEYCPALITQFADQVCPAVLYCLDEADPIVAHALWLAVLHVMSVVPDWSSKVNLKKGLYPKLWTLLKNGGYGSAVVSYPNLVPFLNFLPLETEADKMWFHERFFCEMKAGLAMRQVQQSPSETNAIVKAFVECIHFCIKHELASSSCDQKFLNYLILEQLVPLIEASLSETSTSLSNSRLYDDVVGLLFYIQRVTIENSSEKTGKEMVMESIFSKLMQELSKTILSTIKQGDTETLLRTMLLLEAFSGHQEPRKRTNRRPKKFVKFAKEDLQNISEKLCPEDASSVVSKVHENKTGSSDVGVGLENNKEEIDSNDLQNSTLGVDAKVTRPDIQSSSDTEQGDVMTTSSDVNVFSKDSSSRVSMLQQNKILTELVNEACLQSLTLARKSQTPGYLPFFSRTFKAFASEELASFLIGRLQTDASDSTTASFICNILLPWLLKISPETNPPLDAEAAEHLVEVTVVSWNLLDSESKMRLLSHMIETLRDCSILYRLLLQLLLSNQDASVRLWLCEAEFRDFMVSVTNDLCRQTSEVGSSDKCSEWNSKWNLLCFAMASEKYREPNIGEKSLSCLLEVIRSALPSHLEADDESINQCFSFVCDVASQLLISMREYLLIQSYEALLLSIFQLSLQPPFLSPAVTDKVHATWAQGIHTLLCKSGASWTEESFLSKATACLKDFVHNKADTVIRLKQLADIAYRMQAAVIEACGSASKIEGVLLKNLCGGFVESEVTCWKEPLIVSGEVLFNLTNLAKPAPVQLDNIPKCLAPVIFTSLFLTGTSSIFEKSNPDAISSECKVKETVMYCVGDESEQLHESDKITVGLETKGLEFLATNVEIFLDLAVGLAFCQVVTRNQVGVKSSSELYVVTSLLEKNYAILMSQLKQDVLMRIVLASFERSLEKGGLHSLGLQVLLLRLKEMQFKCDYMDLVGGLDRFHPLTPSLVATLQVAMPIFEADSVAQLVNLCLAQMISCLDDDITSFLEPMTLSLVVLNKALSLHDSHCSEEVTLFADPFLGTFSQICSWRENHDSLFLFSTTFSLENWELAVFNIEVMRFFTLAVARFPTALDNLQWDTVLCSLVSWIQSISEVQVNMVNDLLALTFTAVASDLLQAVAVCMLFVLPEQPSAFPQNLLSEWKDLFCPAAFDVILALFFNISEKVSSSADTAPEVETMLCHLCSAVIHCPTELLLKHKLSTRLIADMDTNLPDSLQTFLNYCCPLLSSPHRSVQLAAYKLLQKLIPELPKYEEKTPPDSASCDTESSRCPAQCVMAIIESANSVIRILLDDAEFGEVVVIDPFTPAFTSLMAYLLSWNLLLQFFQMSTSELRVQYAQWISERGIVDFLLRNVFNIMPQNPVVVLKDSLVADGASKKLSSVRNMFAEDPAFEFQVFNGNQLVLHLQHVACAIYRHMLETLPAIVRQWWNEQDKCVSATVEKFTSKHLSPLLCAKELQAIQETNGSFLNMSIKVRSVTREVIATYALEESSMELVITLPANMPFGTVAVESGSRVGVTKPQWRNWMLQLIVFLHHQNGSLLDALSLYKRNVDKHFEGVEDCMICFSVIHGSNYQLPKLQCKACRKLFHAACLYKWFKTSNNSACPLCRNIF